MKKVYIILSIIIAVIALLFLTFRFMPAQYIIGILGDNNISSLACSYPVRIAGDSMEPDFRSDQTAIFNKCFTQDDLTIHKIIAFQNGDVIRLGIINSVENLPGGLTYKVVQSNRRDSVSDVSYNQIVAIYKKEFGGQSQKETDKQAGEPVEIKILNYNLTLPAGWQIAKEDNEQSVYVNTNEIPENNFQTYLSVSRDKIPGGTLSDYFNNLKNEIKKSAVGIVFDNENSVKINKQDALAADGYVRQNNTNFKILTVAVKGRDDDVWVFNFNSTESKWEENAPIFEQILKSFIIK